MINFDSENIRSVKEILKTNDIKNIKKENFFKRHKNGWGLFLLEKEIETKNLAAITIFSLPPKTHIAHRHTSDIDYEYCHYVLNTNDECGIIIDNEFIKYYNGLLFSFNYGLMPHIVWNNGNTFRDSLVFVFKKDELDIQDWYTEKNKVVNNEYIDSEELTRDQIETMTKRFNVKFL